MKSNVVALYECEHEHELEHEHEHGVDLEVDGERVTVVANRELVLRCGKASITLTRAGKIILKGTHLVSSSSGVNKLQGTQIRIN